MSGIKCVLMVLGPLAALTGNAQTAFPDPSAYYSDFGKPEIQANEAFVMQNGNSNYAIVDQQEDLAGTGNFARTNQIGVGNIVNLTQLGSANRARVEQNGNSNTANISQNGANNSLDLTQLGNGNSFNMTQTGESSILASQEGNNNVVDAPAIGVGGSGTLIEKGDNNSITVSPNYNGPGLQSVILTGGLSITVN